MNDVSWAIDKQPLARSTLLATQQRQCRRQRQRQVRVSMCTIRRNVRLPVDSGPITSDWQHWGMELGGQLVVGCRIARRGRSGRRCAIRAYPNVGGGATGRVN